MRVRRWVAVAGSGALALAGLVAVGGAPAGAGAPSGPVHTFFDPTPGENLDVPDGVCGAFVQATGAGGGAGTSGEDYASGPGGFGGYAVGWVPLAPGDNLEVRVGGAGDDGTDETGSANGGVNGGGNGAPNGSTIFGGGGGGGYSGIFLEGDDNQPLVVAGGGGGGGIVFPSDDARTPGAGGEGSGADGDDGSDGVDTNADPVIRGGGGAGGTDSAGGAGGASADSFTGANGSNGAYLQGGAGGGDTENEWGYAGGGGGGLYGGGGGADSLTASGGGGGGSGLVPDVLGDYDSDVNEGDGSVVVTWTPCSVDVVVSKTVTGNDPGVAFPMTVTCEATFASDVEGPEVEDADIQLSPETTSGSAVVNLKGGEQATVVVAATAALDSLDCTVVEGAATLPSSFTCAPAEYVPDANPFFWDEGLFMSDSEPVQVVNSCNQAVEVLPNFTG